MAFLQTFNHKACPIHYRLEGPLGTTKVVFTHGIGMDHHCFERQVPAIAPGYRLLLWDMRGHGRSRPGSEHFSIRQAAADLHALIDHLGWHQVVLVGLAEGGYVAQELAHQHAQRVAAMVVVGADSLTTGWSLDQWAARIAALEGLRLTPWPLYRRLRARRASKQQAVREYVSAALEGWSHPHLTHMNRQVLQGKRGDPDYRLNRPLLLIHGEQEPSAMVRRRMPAWAEREPLARLSVFPEAGRLVNMEQPAAFNALLWAFLNELENKAL